MRGTAGRNTDKVSAAAAFSKQRGVDLRTIELDVASEPPVNEAAARIVAEHGRVDVLMHKAGLNRTGLGVLLPRPSGPDPREARRPGLPRPGARKGSPGRAWPPRLSGAGRCGSRPPGWPRSSGR
jgi:NAD(P)-dependent dehydrogenase (short-subunit alcohol dehydrogenase family)